MSDFYLGSTESRELWARPRSCAVIKRIPRRHDEDALLIRLMPALIAEIFELTGPDIEHVIVAPHYVGDTLIPISKWPLPVYVVRSRAADASKLDFLEDAELEIIAWGELYPTEDAARGVHNPG